jgi:D-xylose 1-dehydrogenase (NADP+, D-xylono-1,5-lactone-forming)
VLGAAWIAGRAVIPALQESRNGRVIALASRRPGAARALAKRHSIERVYDAYERILDDRDVDAVYIPLVNSLHREWTERSLEAGKHVLCEKPLALNAAEAESMATTARREKRLLMEAFMYRFHPRMRAFREGTRTPRFLHAAFGFSMTQPDNYRARPELGGGALLDTGCYCVDVARWFLGEPAAASAGVHVVGGVDVSVSAVLSFAREATATLWGSFESGERQLLVVVDETGPRALEQPFTAWRDPDDPYRLMVEAFADSVLTTSAPPRLLEESIAGLRVLDAIRRDAGIGGR